MNRRDLAEMFAAQSAPKGKASALYFEGPVAYSYGQHFPIAVIASTRSAIVNTDKYSRSTSAHQSAIRAALVAHGYSIAGADTAAIKAFAAKHLAEVQS